MPLPDSYQRPALAGSQSAANAIQRISYTHDAMIDFIIANPMMQQNQIAEHFGYRPAWISRIFNSDAFRKRLAERQSELIDPTIAAGVEEKFQAVVSQSLDIIAEKLESRNADLALKTLELGAKAFSYGARDRNAGVQVNNYVVALPAQAPNAGAWADKYQNARPTGLVIDGATKES